MFKKLKIKTLVFSIAALAFASGGLYAQSVNNWNDFNDAIAGGATSIAFTTDTVLFSNNLPQINYAGPVTFSGSVTLDGGTLYQIFNIANTAAVFNDSINFVDAGNSASGGALSASGNSTVSFNGAYVNFRNNYSGQTAQGGGGAGIYITGAASVEFNVSTAVFTNNSAASWGAGIDLLNGGTLSMNADYIEFSSNTALGRGAAIAATYGNTINLNAGSVVFYNNRAENTPASPNITGDPLYRGGALLSQQANYYIKADDIKFINNYAKGWGGAIFSGSNLGGGGRSYLSFESGSILFDGNKADAKAGLLDVGASLGGAIAATATDMYFSGGQAVFSNNSVAGSAGAGGAFLISGNSDVHFNSDITGFNSNTGAIGGAIALRSSTITFAPQNYVQFTNNSTSGMGTLGGGAIYSESSIMKFTGGQTLFSGNAAKSGIGSTVGGAIHMTSASKAEFASSSVNFTSNTASTNGGAVYEEAGSNSVFTGADVVFNTNSAGAAASAYGGALFADSSSYLFANNTTVFSGNKAGGRGGALYAANGSAITFNSANASFSGNQVTNGSGGAIYAYNSSAVTFTGGQSTFDGNIAASSGGAVYNGASSTMNFGSSAVNFLNNSASNGGAVYADSGSYTSFSGGAVSFTGNTAGNLGGALYVISSTVSFNTDNGEAVFSGNTAGGAPNDVYMNINSQLNISGAKAIRFEDGIVTEVTGSGIAINKSGTGAMYLGGDNQVWGDFNITAGDIIMLDNAAYKGKALEAANGSSALDMSNATVNTVDVTGNFATNKNLKMDIFADGTNDVINAGTANIGGNLDIFAGVGTYSAKEYDLIITTASGNLSGTFSTSSISNKKLLYELVYDSDKIVKLIITGVSETNFEEIIPLTYNQKETAGAFKKISANPGVWAPILNDMMTRQNSRSDADIAAVKEFLAKTSGYFLSNAIRNMAADSPNNEVYDKIRNHAQEHITNSGLWVQLRGGLETFREDDNSLRDYRDLSYGVMLGFDRFLADKVLGGDLMWGVYGRFNKNNITQGLNKADGTNNGLGLYGGYIRDSWELKAMVLGSYDMFNTQRGELGPVSKADITGITVSGDLEAALKIGLTESLKLRPFAGLEIANTNYGDFKETGGGIYDLDTKGGNYLRSAGRVGAGVDYEKGIWIWYANVEGKCVFEGTKPEIESQFNGTGIEFNSRGADEKNVVIGAGAGGEVRISQHWKGFANAKYYIGEKYESIYGNIGVRYLFGKGKSKADEEANRLADEKAKLQAAQEAAAQQAKLEAQRQAEAAAAAEEARKQALAREEAAKAQRIAEEAAITKEISDADLAKQKAEAEARRKRPMLKTYTLTTHFATNSYELNEEDKKQIDAIAEELKGLDFKKITIEGHTDNTGSKETNKRLSRQRARSVYDEFINAGISSEKMTYQGFADTMPVKSNSTAEGRAANRRTEIFVE